MDGAVGTVLTSKVILILGKKVLVHQNHSLRFTIPSTELNFHKASGIFLRFVPPQLHYNMQIALKRLRCSFGDYGVMESEWFYCLIRGEHNVQGTEICAHMML